MTMAGEVYGNTVSYFVSCGMGCHMPRIMLLGIFLTFLQHFSDSPSSNKQFHIQDLAGKLIKRSRYWKRDVSRII